MRALFSSTLVALVIAGTPAIAQPAEPAPSATPPELPTNEGWNSDWGMLFSLNNVLVQGSILSGFQGLGTAGSFFLSPDLSVRAGVSVSRAASPTQVTRTEVASAGEKVVTYGLGIPGSTSTLSTTVRADVLYRLRPSAIAPYVGGGLSVGYSRQRLAYTDDVSIPEQTITLNNTTTGLSVGARGTAGAEWRFHPNFAVFAEYELQVNVITWNDLDNETVVENRTGGTRTVTRTTQDRSVPVWFTGQNFLSQGGAAGLLVFF